MSFLLTLGWMSLQAACLTLAIWVFRRVVGDRVPAWLWSGAWLLVLVRLVVPWQPEHGWTLYEPVAEEARRVVIAPLTDAPLVPVSAAQGSGPTLPDEVQVRAAASDPRSFLPLVLGVWCLGVLLVTVRLMRRAWRTRALLRRATPLSDPRAHAALARVERRAGVRRKVRLLSSEAVATPAATGLFRWRIIVPSGLALGDDEWDAVLAHELAHLSRGDLAVRAMYELAVALHWPNPAVWIARRCMVADQELAADARAARTLGSRAAYGLGLVEALGRCRATASRTALAYAAGSGRSELARRVRALAELRPTALRTGLVVAGLAVVACETLSTPSPHLPTLAADRCVLARVDVRGAEARNAEEVLSMMRNGEITPRYGAAAVGYQGALYVAGGSGPTGFINTVERYDPATELWSVVARGLVPRRYLTAVVVGDVLYLMGGYDSDHHRVPTVERVSLVSGDVSHAADLPRPRYFGAAGALDRYIYFGGGVWEDERLASVDRYDVVTDTWTEGPSLSSGRDLRIATVGGDLYALGGYAGRGAPAVTRVERLDVEANLWVPVTDMPRPTTAFSATDLAGTILTFGDYEEMGRVLRFDPMNGHWTTIEADFMPRRHSVATTIGDRVYVFGGNTESRLSWSNRLEVFELSCGDRDGEGLTTPDGT